MQFHMCSPYYFLVAMYLDQAGLHPMYPLDLAMKKMLMPEPNEWPLTFKGDLKVGLYQAGRRWELICTKRNRGNKGL